ncbi:MAG: gliding motility-associated C-terminal domain-containing protein [Bacteroidales bacterium]|jgi:gliding motility-associated-like protein|nr:gliding motility-associated C-terminal domain-containing protein [Bacteroidales bacterium]
MEQLRAVFFRLTLLLLFVLSVSPQAAFAQTCSITIETNRVGNININNGVNSFTLHVNFGEVMDQSTLTVVFSQSIGFAFSGAPDVTWASDNKSCSIKYTVTSFADSNNAYDVYAEVTAKTTGQQDFSCESPLFQVDNKKPSCIVSCNPPTITPQTTGNFVITVRYNEEMDHAKAPDIAFEKDVTETLGGAPTSVWSGNDYTVTYPILPASQQRESPVNISVTNGYDKAGNVQNQGAGNFSIEMSRTVGVVSFVSAPGGGAHVNKQSTAFDIKTTYSGKMQEATVPSVVFDKSVTASLTETAQEWSGGGTAYTWHYTVQSASTQNETVEATVSGGKDIAGKDVDDSKGTFRIDFAAPTCQKITAPDVSKTTTNYTVTVTYDEEMSSAAPTLTIEPAEASAVFDASGGSWDATGKIYTAGFTVSRTPPGVYVPAAGIKVSGAADVAGNAQEEANRPFTVDQRDTDVSVSMNPSTIQSSSSSAVLTLTFNVNMDQTSTPTVAFDPSDMQGAITPGANSARWVDGKTWTIEYDLDKTKKVNIPDIDVTVSGARNADGETMSAVRAADVFTVNFLAPSCVVTFTPAVVLNETPTLTVTLVYDTEMNTASAPNITWGGILIYKPTFTNERFVWNDNKTCVFTYDIVDNDVQNPYILLTANSAESVAGNVQVESKAANLLVVDMLDFVVSATPSSPVINCSSSQLVITVGFNQPMDETKNDIISFPNFDPEGFITPVKTEWTGSNNMSAFVAEYAIHPDQPAGSTLTASVDVAVASVNNYLGRAYPGETVSSVFSAVSAPPDITGASAIEPQCYGIENGEIHITVNGGTNPLTYAWTKDGEPFTATEADVTGLGAGKYDVVIEGSDQCFATRSVTLTNPESVTLTAEVRHHLEKRDDGEIVLTASGGTPPYTYYMDNSPQGDQTGYTGLDAGIYSFEVRDANSCAALASAEVKNYQAPTIFTPNGDTYNDIFMEGHTVEIFDRNGTLIYKGDNGWDGRYQGQIVRPAVYFYIITFSEGYKKKGTIQLYKP